MDSTMRYSIFGLHLFLASGCATILHGSSQDIAIASTPPGASAKLSNGQTFTTPLVVNLKRNESYVVTFEKAGYQTTTASINNSWENWPSTVFGNHFWLLLGFLVGFLVGGAYELEPKNVNVPLTPVGQARTNISSPSVGFVRQRRDGQAPRGPDHQRQHKPPVGVHGPTGVRVGQAREDR
jgi:hypothetical protein